MQFKALLVAFTIATFCNADTHVLELRNRIPGSRDNLAERGIERRKVTKYDESCQRQVPGMRVKMTRQRYFDDALKDAIAMAKNVKDITEASPAIDAFSNYFFLPSEQTTFPEAATQLDKFKKMMKRISSAPLYSFKVNCPDPGDPKFVSINDPNKCSDTSQAVTDPTPGRRTESKEIILCPKFYDDTDSRRLLSTERPGPTGWGDRTKILKKYVTRGHIILHELTHLHIIGEAADLPEDGNLPGGQRTRGTEDLDGFSDVAGARDLKTHIVDTLTSRALSPDAKAKELAKVKDGMIKNAESYAGAATEYWMRTVGKRATPIKVT